MEKLEVLRKQKIFVLGDIVIYAITMALIVGLLCWALIPAPMPLREVWVYYANTPIYCFNCTNQTGKILHSQYVQETQEGEDIIVVVTTPKGTNTLVFGSTIFIKQSDCPHKTCLVFKPIAHGGDVVMCVPHALRLVGVGEVSNEVVL